MAGTPTQGARLSVQDCYSAVHCLLPGVSWDVSFSPGTAGSLGPAASFLLCA